MTASPADRPSAADHAHSPGNGVGPGQSEQSQSRIVPPSTKLANGRAPMQLTRARTNSLTSRRFGRPLRPLTICGDEKTLNGSVD